MLLMYIMCIYIFLTLYIHIYIYISAVLHVFLLHIRFSLQLVSSSPYAKPADAAASGFCYFRVAASELVEDLL